MDRLSLKSYEFDLRFSGILTQEQRDEIDGLRNHLHELGYKYTRKNLNDIERITRDIAMAKEALEAEKKEIEGKKSKRERAKR